MLPNFLARGVFDVYCGLSVVWVGSSWPKAFKGIGDEIGEFSDRRGEAREGGHEPGQDGAQGSDGVGEIGQALGRLILWPRLPSEIGNAVTLASASCCCESGNSPEKCSTANKVLGSDSNNSPNQSFHRT
jgi:hypothetical protein